MDPAYELAEPLKLEFSVNGRTTQRVFGRRDQFAAELVYFSDCIFKDRVPEPSVADVRIVRAVIESAETNRAVKISPIAISKRPTVNQRSLGLM